MGLRDSSADTAQEMRHPAKASLQVAYDQLQRRLSGTDGEGSTGAVVVPLPLSGAPSIGLPPAG